MTEPTVVVAEVVDAQDVSDLLEALDQEFARVGQPDDRGQVEIVVDDSIDADGAREQVASAAARADPDWLDRLHLLDFPARP